MGARDDDLQPVTACSSGSDAYDRAGNVKSIGADQYQYDKVSRLVASNLGASAPGRSQSYTFDLYGNLTSKTTDGGSAVTFPVSPSTGPAWCHPAFVASPSRSARNGS